MADRGQRFQGTGQIQAGSLRTGAAQELMNLSQQFQQFSQQAFDFAEQRFVEQDIQAGRESFVEGEKPEFKEEGFIGGVRAKAFNKGLRHSYLASLSNDVSNDLSVAELENKDDVQGYSAKIEGLRNALMKEVDPSVRLDVIESFDKSANFGLERVRKNQAVKIRNGQIEVSEQARDNLLANANIAARSGNREQAVDELQKLELAFNDAVDAELISRTDANEGMRIAGRMSTEQSILGKLENTAREKSIPEAVKELDELPREPPANSTQQEWDKFKVSAGEHLNRLRSRQNLLKREKLDEGRGFVNDYMTALATGIPVNPEDAEKARNIASLDPELSKAVGVSEQTASAMLSPRVERLALEDQAKSGAIEDVDMAVSLIRANAAIDKEAKKDGMGLLQRQGLIDPVPLDFTNADTLSQGVEARAEQAAAVARHTGFPTSIFTDQEAAQLSEALTSVGDDGRPAMTVNDKMKMAMAFRDTPEVWGQLDSKGAGLFAMVGAIGDEAVMQEVLKGQEFLDAKVYRTPDPLSYMDEFNDQIEGVYGPEDAKNILSATLAHYVQTSGNKTGTYSASDFRTSLMAVTGGIGKVNGFKVELPRGVGEDVVDDFIDDIQPETIKRLGGVSGITDQRAVEIIKNARLVNTKSDGIYRVEHDNGTLFSAEDPTKPFTINWSNDLLMLNQSFMKGNRKGRGRRRRQRAPDSVASPIRTFPIATEGE